MPLVSLTTNAKFESEDAKKAFISDFSKTCAKTIGKDEGDFTIEVTFNPYLVYGGTFDPAFMLKIACLDNTNPTNSQVWSREFSTFFNQKLGVSIERGLMAFTDPGPAFVGWMGSTVAALRAAAAKK